MGEKKNIDRLFQEKFKNFEAIPKPELWNGIHGRLHPKKKKRRVIPIWWCTTGGVAAALILFFALGGTNLFNDRPKENFPIVDIDLPKNIESKKDSLASSFVSSANNAVASENNVNTNSKKTTSEINSTIPNSKQKKNTSSTSVAKNKTGLNPSKGTPNQKISDSKTSEVASNSSETINKESEASNTMISLDKASKLIKSSSAKDATKVAIAEELNIESSKEDIESEMPNEEKSLEDIIAESNDIIEEEEENLNRWSITPNVAPIYFNSLSGGSAIDGQFNDNTNQGNVTMSYGIAGTYALNKRLKIRAGVNRVDFNHITNNVLSVSGSDFSARSTVAGIENISLIPSENDITLLSSSNFLRASVPEAINTAATGNLDQRFGFIEIPFGIEYRVLDKKFGVNLLGGFSTFFLNYNEIYADINGSSKLIGRANNLKDTSYSANFGVGFDYGLSNNIDINLEPMFKYQINTFSNTSGDFQPFFIGVYTGLSFRF